MHRYLSTELVSDKDIFHSDMLHVSSIEPNTVNTVWGEMLATRRTSLRRISAIWRRFLKHGCRSPASAQAKRGVPMHVDPRVQDACHIVITADECSRDLRKTPLKCQRTSNF
jgi:hypothetical protein